MLPASSNADPARIAAKVQKWTLVKYDGEMPEGGVGEDIEALKADPRCQEILEGGDDRPTICVYRRSE